MEATPQQLELLTLARTYSAIVIFAYVTVIVVCGVIAWRNRKNASFDWIDVAAPAGMSTMLFVVLAYFILMPWIAPVWWMFGK